MEILEIQSTHSLITSMTDQRAEGVHSYQINCRHFDSMQQSWLNKGATRGQALSVLTRKFERIWFTAKEVATVAAAIRSARSPLALG